MRLSLVVSATTAEHLLEELELRHRGNDEEEKGCYEGPDVHSGGGRRR